MTLRSIIHSFCAVFDITHNSTIVTYVNSFFYVHLLRLYRVLTVLFNYVTIRADMEVFMNKKVVAVRCDKAPLVRSRNFYGKKRNGDLLFRDKKGDDG